MNSGAHRSINLQSIVEKLDTLIERSESLAFRVGDLEECIDDYYTRFEDKVDQHREDLHLGVFCEVANLASSAEDIQESITGLNFGLARVSQLVNRVLSFCDDLWKIFTN